MHLPTLPLAITALTTLLTSPALAQTGTGYFITIPTTGVASQTAATAAPTATGLPGLVSQLPDCAIPCFTSATETINCGASDFSCLCQTSNLNSFAVNIGSCLTGGLGGDGGPASEDSACALSNLSSLAARICQSVNERPEAGELSSASAIVSEKLAGAEATGSASSPSSTSGGKNQAGRKPEGPAMGMLAVVAAYAVLAL